MGWTGFSRSSRTVCVGGEPSKTPLPKPGTPSSTSTLPSAHLQFSQGIVTLFLAWRLLGAHGDELVDTVGHCPARSREFSEWVHRSSFLGPIYIGSL